MKGSYALRIASLLIAFAIAAILAQGCDTNGKGCSSCADSEFWSMLTACVDCSGCKSCDKCSSDSDVSGTDRQLEVSGADEASASDETTVSEPAIVVVINQDDAQNDDAQGGADAPAGALMPAANAVSGTDAADDAGADAAEGENAPDALGAEGDTTAEETTPDEGSVSATDADSVVIVATPEATTAATTTATTADPALPTTTTTTAFVLNDGVNAISVPTNPDGTVIIPGTAKELPTLTLLKGETMGVPDGMVLALGARETREDTIVAIANPDGRMVVLLCHADTKQSALESVAACYPDRKVAVYRSDRECFVWLRDQSSYVVHNGSSAVRVDPALEIPAWVTGEKTALSAQDVAEAQYKLDRARQYTGTRNGFVVVATDIDIYRYAWGKKASPMNYVEPEKFPGMAAPSFIAPIPGATAVPAAAAAPVSGSDAVSGSDLALPMLTMIDGKAAGLPDGKVLVIAGRELRGDAIVGIANPNGSEVLLFCGVDTRESAISEAAARYANRKAAVYRSDKQSFVWLRAEASAIVHNGDCSVSLDPALEKPVWVGGKVTPLTPDEVKNVAALLDDARQYSSTRGGFVVIANDIEILRYYWGKKNPSYDYIDPVNFKPITAPFARLNGFIAAPAAGEAAAAPAAAAAQPTSSSDVAAAPGVDASAPTRVDGSVVIPNTGADLPLASLFDGKTFGVDEGMVLAIGSELVREDTVIAITVPDGKSVLLLCESGTKDSALAEVAKQYKGKKISTYRTDRESFAWLRGGASFTVYNGGNSKVAVDPALTAPEWVGETETLSEAMVKDAIGKYEDAQCYDGPRNGFVVVATHNDILRYWWGKRDYSKK